MIQIKGLVPSVITLGIFLVPKKIAPKVRKKNRNRERLSLCKSFRRHLPDSNRRGRSPVDFESTALTTRPRCRWTAARRHRRNDQAAPRPCTSPHHTPVFLPPPNADRSYHAGVSSDRTNLSPFTKDYRGLALQCD